MGFRMRMGWAVVIITCAIGAARGADLPGVPVYSSAPAALAAGPTMMSGSSASCATGLSRFTASWRGVPSCSDAACDTSRFHLHRQKAPYSVTLCPGACFGYFPTQWRKWDEVCPYPYQGDATAQPVPYLPPTIDLLPKDKTGEVTPPPRPVDPKTGMPMPPPNGGGLPMIPQYPGPGRY